MRIITDCIIYQNKKNPLSDYVEFSVTIIEKGKRAATTPFERYESPYKNIPEGNARDCKRIYDAFKKSGAKEISRAASQNHISLKSRKEREV